MHVVPDGATVRTCEECSHCHFHPNGAPSAAVSQSVRAESPL